MTVIQCLVLNFMETAIRRRAETSNGALGNVYAVATKTLTFHLNQLLRRMAADDGSAAISLITHA